MTPSRPIASRRSLRTVAAVLALGAAAAVQAPAALAATATVCAARESDPVKFSTQPGTLPDGADDAAIFIHPTDRSKSTFIGVDKLPGTGISVYDMSGKEIQFVPATAQDRWNNDDLRYNFPLGGKRVTLLGATNRERNSIDFWTVDESTGKLNTTLVGRITIPASTGVQQAHGLALYHSPVSGRYYAFVTYRGWLAQFELDGSSGEVTGTVVRQDWHVSNATEGLVADDEHKVVYLAEETSAQQDGADTGGVDRFGAEPGDAKERFRVDSTTDNTAFPAGHITKDTKGLAMYYGANGTGYLVAASQGGDDYHVYDRQFAAGRANAWRGSFAVGSCLSQPFPTDKVTATDGIDVTNASLGGAFASGMFVVQDDKDTDPASTQNYKMVPWKAIADGLGLTVDTSFDPRSIGATGVPGATAQEEPQPQRQDQSVADAPSGSGPGGAVLAGAQIGGLPAFGARPGVRTSISARRGLRAGRDGRVRFTLRNDNPFAVRVSLALESGGGVKLARTLKTSVGARRTVSLKLTGRARRMLARSPRKVELTLKLRDPQGNTRAAWVTFRLRGPR